MLSLVKPTLKLLKKIDDTAHTELALNFLIVRNKVVRVQALPEVGVVTLGLVLYLRAQNRCYVVVHTQSSSHARPSQQS